MSGELEHGRQWVAVARRGWKVVMVCVVVGVGLGVLVAKTSTKKYSSTAALLFQQDGLSQQLFGYSTTSPVNPQTADSTSLELVTQPAVAARTGRVLGLTTQAVTNMVTAAQAGETDIVDVTATSPSSTEAARVVNAYAHEFIAYRQQADRAQVKQAISELQSQISHLRAKRGASGELANLSTRLSQLEVLQSIQTGDVQLVQPGTVSASPSSPNIKKDVGVGLIIGLVIGLMIASILERVDQRVRDHREVVELVGLPVLGEVPRSRALSHSDRRFREAEGMEAEAFRLLRTQLRYFNVDRAIRSVLITSAGPGDGKSTVAWHLARQAAASGRDSSVLLVDLDLRKPTLARLAGLTGSPGIERLLTQEIEIDEVVHHIQVPGANGTLAGVLDFIPAGAGAPNPYELTESNKLRRLLVELQERYDLVVIDAPPTSVVSDAIPLMNQVSGVLVVVRVLKTGRSALRGLLEQIRQVRANALGLVLNDVRQTSQNYGGYYYHSASTAPKATVTLRDPGETFVGSSERAL